MIAASALVRRERQRAALAQTAALLGRDFYSFEQLANACAGETALPIRHVLADYAWQELVRQSALQVPGFEALIRERPRIAGILAANLRDLRDAGVEPNALPLSLGALIPLYKEVEKVLGELQRDGIVDRIGLFRLATKGAAAWIARRGFDQVELHGATELVGSTGDLIEAIGDVIPLRMFQADFGHSYAEELRATWPWRFQPAPQPIVEKPAALQTERLHAIAAATPHAEIAAVLERVRTLLESGAKPERIFIVARTLKAYGESIIDPFQRAGIPVSTSFSRSILEDSWVQAALALSQALIRGLERDAVLRMLRSPHLVDVPSWSVADRLARSAPVLRGIEDWTAALDHAGELLRGSGIAADPTVIAELRTFLEKLELESQKVSRTSGWQSMSRSLHFAFRNWLGDSDEVGDRSLRVLEELSELDRISEICGSDTAFTAGTFLRLFEDALRQTEVRPYTDEKDGVQILDAPQARAASCDHLFLVGFNHGHWPLEKRENPFLPATVREELRERDGRPVPIPSLQALEEDFLVGMLLHQACESATISWHLHDAAGRQTAPSSYIHRVPGLGISLLERISQIEAEPVLPVIDDELNQGIYHAGIEYLRIVEDESATSLAFDGQIGTSANLLADPRSPSAIEQLGRCPLHALFARILRVPELDILPEHHLDARESGSAIHAVLALLFQELETCGAFAPGQSAESTIRLAADMLPDIIDRSAEIAKLKLERRHPALWRALRTQLERACIDFIQREFPRLLPEGIQNAEFETEVAWEFKSSGRTLKVEGRADRILTRSSGDVIVSDYKTRKDPDSPVRIKDIERGDSLQLPLYMLAIGAAKSTRSVSGEILAVPSRPERDRGQVRQKDRHIDLDQIQVPAEQTLNTLVDLLDGGVFPLRRDSHCGFCAYRIACRREHAPTRARVDQAVEFAGYHRLRGDKA